MFNPRFPHSLSVLRAKRDEDGQIVFDDNGDALYEKVAFRVVESVDGEPLLNGDGEFITSESTEISFGYRTNSKNIRERGNVVVADFKLACPMFFGELLYDDVVVLTDYDRTFKAVLVKKTTYNMGTNIWVNEIEN